MDVIVIVLDAVNADLVWQRRHCHALGSMVILSELMAQVYLMSRPASSSWKKGIFGSRHYCRAQIAVIAW